ncbi:MAG: hypothetical protein P1U64_06190 [Alcanivoracaceae bacterium]|nr:hypothetical protein [Alcanivoracaceae bacterium]
MRRIDRARVWLVLGMSLAFAGRVASELALAGVSEQFAVLMGAGVLAWFAGLGLLAAGALFSAWLFVSEGSVLVQRSVRRLAVTDSR